MHWTMVQLQTHKIVITTSVNVICTVLASTLCPRAQNGLSGPELSFFSGLVDLIIDILFDVVTTNMDRYD